MFQCVFNMLVCPCTGHALFSRQNLSPALSIPRDLRSPIGVHLIYAETWQPRSRGCLRFQGLSPYRGLSRTDYDAAIAYLSLYTIRKNA